MKPFYLSIIFIIMGTSIFGQNKLLRGYGVEIGVLQTGKNNAITDVPGVKVGHTTIIKEDHIRTGVTAIIPHDGNIFQEKVPAAIYLGNGFGKLAGYSQVKELGNIETPIILTNTLSVPTAMDAVNTYTLLQPGNENVRSVNAIVGETNDGYLNDIRGRHVTQRDVLLAIQEAQTGPVEEGNVGAGTGTIAFRHKGGIGTSSRILPKKLGGYTLGVLVQANFGGILQIAGVPIAKELELIPDSYNYDSDGSCMIVVMTDAPLDARNLERLAKRAMLGLGRTGGIASNGSGDYVIAVSTAEQNRIPYNPEEATYQPEYLHNSKVTPLFEAVIESTEEAIYNALFAANDMQGRDGNTIKALPVDQVIEIMRKYNRVKTQK